MNQETQNHFPKSMAAVEHIESEQADKRREQHANNPGRPEEPTLGRSVHNQLSFLRARARHIAVVGLLTGNGEVIKIANRENWNR